MGMPIYKSPAKPIEELMKIMNSEVPMACFIDKLAKNNRAGMIKNPPPAPKNPVIIPITEPIIANCR